MLLVYGALLLGTSTTLYPLLIMLSTSTKSAADQNDNSLVPAYFSNTTENKATSPLEDGSLLGKYLVDKYMGDLNAINSSRIGASATSDEVSKFRKFLEDLPTDRFNAAFRTGPSQVTSRLAMRYQDWLRKKWGTIEALNKAYVEENTSFLTVAPPIEQLENFVYKPATDQKSLDYQEFKRELPAEFRIPIRSQWIYQSWQRTKTRNQFKDVDSAVVGKAANFEELEIPAAGPVRAEFYEKRLPPRFIKETTEDQWAKISPNPMPIVANEKAWVTDHSSEVRSEFVTRNYRYVLGYILLNSRVLVNTALFCGLTVLIQLTVNPLAAYALSRYPLPSTGKILIFLLATMAFPAEVAMIPSFLLLRDLGLLNTFAALVLPGAASGYMIFLLKGFFDSLPRELYEAAQIDGARETTLMMRIAFPLSKPVLGYLAMLAFMGSYGAFLYAFLIAQDRKIWTLMVWIYQLQSSAPKSVMMAALTIAMLPTLTVFLLAQRVLMRGIVLPDSR